MASSFPFLAMPKPHRYYQSINQSIITNQSNGHLALSVLPLPFSQALALFPGLLSCSWTCWDLLLRIVPHNHQLLGPPPPRNLFLSHLCYLSPKTILPTGILGVHQELLSHQPLGPDSILSSGSGFIYTLSPAPFWSSISLDCCLGFLSSLSSS